MAAPERRVRGRWLVATLLIVALLFAIPVYILRPQSVLGPPLLFLRAEGDITANRTDVALPADFGPHCSKVYVDPRGFLAAESDVDFTNVDALLLQHVVPGTGTFVSTGGDLLRSFFRVVGTAWLLTSPIDNRTLITLTRDGANVTADSVTTGAATYGPGSRWADRFEYDVVTPAGNVHIVESVEFSNLGLASPRIVPPAACA